MVDVLARNWGWIALRGAVAVLFGLLTLFNPAISLAVLVLLFGVFALVDGLFASVAAVANRHDQPRWVELLISGIIGIAIGIVTLFWPGVTAFALLYLIAAWALVTGIGEVAAAIRLRKVIRGEWLLALAGVLSIIFGLLLFIFPVAGALAVAMWIGFYALVLGITLIVLAFRLRSWHQKGYGGPTPMGSAA